MMGNTYRERVLEMEAPSPSPTGGAADVYFHGWYMGAGAAAKIAAEADARVAELEAECARLRLALDYIANNSGETSHFARAALAAPDAGAVAGGWPEYHCPQCDRQSSFLGPASGSACPHCGYTPTRSEQ